MRAKILFALGTLIIFLLLVFLKVFFSGQGEYRKGEAAFQTRDYQTAITHYDRALHWYFPGSQSVKASASRLWEIGAQAEQRGDPDTALRAFQVLRSGLYSVRSFYTPYPDWIARCDDRIASLWAQREGVPGSKAGGSFLERKEQNLKLLKTRTEPDVFWSLMLELGFLGWVGCTVGFIFRAFSGPDGFLPRRALAWGGWIVLFFALWLLGMLKA